MDSDLHHTHHQQQQQQPQPQPQQVMNSGLTRYRSAPSSYFANLINSASYGGEDCDQFLDPRASSPETERILSRFMSSGGTENSNSQNLCEIGGDDDTVQLQFVASMKQEQVGPHSQQQMIYQSHPQPGHNPVASTSAMDDSFTAVSPMGMDRSPQMKMGCGNNSNLIRQSSSPAGLFSHINIENGYPVMRAMGNFGAGRGTTADSSFSSTKRLGSEMDFPSGSSGLLTRIPETGGKIMGISSSHPEDERFGETHGKDGGYVESFQSGSWDDSANLSDTFLRELGDGDRNTFPSLNSSENQNDEGRNIIPTVLTHHLSLPTSSTELSAMEKLWQFQDSVPLKIRAKRGCATHPRSIAERVRRTRISERMRKLQELVPNMDKQTNTADMLDLAVDYIKDLQKQVETLSDHRAKCTCSK